MLPKAKGGLGGQIQPIVVRRGSKPGKYKLVAGNRRARGAILNRQPILAIMRDLDDAEAYRWALIENIQRRDFNAMALAENIARIRQDHGWDGQPGTTKVAKYLGVSNAQITTHERLLGLPFDIQDQVRKGELSASGAFELADIKAKPGQDTAAVRRDVLKRAAAKQQRAEGAKPKRKPAAKQRQKAAKTADPGDSSPATRSEAGAPTKIKAKYVRQAARETAEAVVSRKRRPLQDVVTLLESLCDNGYPKQMTAFMSYLVDEWIEGGGTETGVRQRWGMLAELLDSPKPKVKGIGKARTKRKAKSRGKTAKAKTPSKAGRARKKAKPKK
jgi:ParB family chromosome partitioning protein